MTDDRARLVGKLARAALLAVFAVVLIRTAWVCDDAYISFRTIDNWHHGFGLRWNPAERVQAYTHPLWMLAVAAPTAVTGEFFYTPMVLGIVVSLAALGWLAFGIARTPAAGVLMVVLALGSKAFVDYGTSGLENPLTHLLIVALAAVAIRGRPDSVRVAGVAGVASLAAVNRLDSLLLFTPVLIAVVAQRGVRRSIPAALLGFAPLFAWESFSVVYYGFPLPNTAYAKLATGIPASELVPQGLRYLVESLVTDPITLISVAGGYAAAFASGERRLQALGVGILAHLAYVVWIGGDFMGGRFLTPAFCAALVPIARLGLAFPSRRTGAWLAAAAAFALLSPHPPLFSGRDYAMEHDRDDWYAGINDERRWYFQWSGWLREDPLGVPMNEHARRGFGLRDRAPTTARFGVVGFLGYNAGPQVHIVDLMALCDPLLARLPAAPGWRIGHFKRLIPRGYMKTLMTGTNQIGDPALARYYAALERVVRGPLFSGARWRAVWQLNSGSLDGLIDTDAYRDPASGRAVRP